MKGHLNLLPCVLGIAAMPWTVLLAENGKSNAGPIESVEAIDYREKTLYHSPETPGYTAWVGLWQLPDRRIRCGFLQLTGPKGNTESHSPNMESVDGGQTWKMLPLPPTDFESGRGMAVLNDGTLVRCAPQIHRSTDGGKTWGPPIHLLPPETYLVRAHLIRPLRDGRLVASAGCWKRDDVALGGVLMPYPHSRLRKWYPKALQLANGKVICISHVGTDDEYGAVDQSILQQTFRLKVVR